jgi:hypothetical protein
MASAYRLPAGLLLLVCNSQPVRAWLLIFFALLLARGVLYRLQARWSQLSVVQFDTIHYSAMAAYKVGVLLLNVVPYIAGARRQPPGPPRLIVTPRLLRRTPDEMPNPRME